MHQAAEKLSRREREVLALLAEGLSAKQIARCLDISCHTSSQYTKNIYQKLNIHCRAQAVLKAATLGLIELSV